MVTSTTIPNPVDWADESILLPHELIRLAILRMETVLSPQKFGDYQDWKLNNFHQWYDNYFYKFVHHHHQIEEQLYFPFLAKKASIPEKMVADHQDLMTLLDDIKSTYELNSLRRKIQELKETMFEHLAEEESFVPSILREHFTPDEEKQIVDQIIQSLGLSGNKMALPWIIDSLKTWKKPEDVASFYNSLPCFIRLLYNCNWKRDYLRNNLGLLESIENNRPSKRCLF